MLIICFIISEAFNKLTVCPTVSLVLGWTAGMYRGEALCCFVTLLAGQDATQPMAHTRSASEEALSLACDGGFQVCAFILLPKHLVQFWGNTCSYFSIRI